MEKARLEVERNGLQVRFIIHCPDEYAAMMLYDNMVKGATIDRCVNFNLTVNHMTLTDADDLPNDDPR